MLGFISGGNTGVTYEQLKKRREMAEALLAASTARAPRNVGEGLTAVGNALAGVFERRRAKREGEELNKYGAEAMARLLAGGAMPPAGGPVGAATPPAGGATPPPAGGATPDGALYGLLKRTEGGGKYDTLFGYANRPGGQFAGVDITKMTLDELAKFTDPSGPYGQYVKGKVGHVATPLGAGQIVGTTLRNAAKALGLPGDTVFSPEIQNRLIGYLAKSALAGAGTPEEKRARLRSTWAGFKSASDAEVDAAVAEIEGGKLGAPTGAAAPPAGATPPAGGATPPTGGTSPRVAQLLAAASDPRLSPENRQLVMTMLQMEMAANKPADPMAAARLAMERERLDETKRMNDARLAGKINDGTNVTINNAGETAYTKENAKNVAGLTKDWYERGLSARRSMTDIDEMESLIKEGATGNGAGWRLWAQEKFGIPLAKSESEAFDAIVARLIPQQRPPGSGVMSDKDVDLFRKSLPGLVTSVEGNQMILRTMRAMAAWDAKVGEIAGRMMTGETDFRKGVAEMNALTDPMTEFLKVYPKGVGADAAKDAPKDAPAAGLDGIPPSFVEMAREEYKGITDEQIRRAYEKANAAKPGGGGAAHKMAVDALPGPQIPDAFKMFAANGAGREMSPAELEAAWSSLNPDQRAFWANQRKENGGFR